jgi:hypothetical protein
MKYGAPARETLIAFSGYLEESGEKMALEICARCRTIFDTSDSETGLCWSCVNSPQKQVKKKADSVARCFQCGAPLSVLERPIGVCGECFSGRR